MSKSDKSSKSKETLIEVARRLQSVDRVVRAVRRDPSIWAAVLDDDSTLRRMVGQLVRDNLHARRDLHTRRGFAGDPDPRESARLRKAGTNRVTERMRESILDWPLWGGLPLRDATRADLDASVKARRAQADSQHAAADFEALVWKAMSSAGVGPKSKVGNALKPEDIVKLRVRASEEAEAA